MTNAERILSMAVVLVLAGGVGVGAGFLLVQPPDRAIAPPREDPPAPVQEAWRSAEAIREAAGRPATREAIAVGPGVGASSRGGALPPSNPDCGAERLLSLLHPMDLPFGRWLASPEAAGFTDPEELREIRIYVTSNAPVVLRPGEVAWLAARIREQDWRHWGSSNVQEAIVLYLGPQRVLDEAPAEWIEELRTWYSDEEWAEVFGAGAVR